MGADTGDAFPLLQGRDGRTSAGSHGVVNVHHPRVQMSLLKVGEEYDEQVRNVQPATHRP